MKTIANTSGQEGALLGFLYTYLAEGEIQKIERTLPAVTTDTHTYDLADQLTAFQRASQAGTLKFSYRFEYECALDQLLKCSLRRRKA